MPNLLELATTSDARLVATISNGRPRHRQGHFAVIVGVVEMRSELLLLAEDVMDLCAELAAPNAETGDLIAELVETADEWAMALSINGKILGKLAFDDVRAAFNARALPVKLETIDDTTSHLTFVSHLRRQREFSLCTFGPGVRTSGVCDHIRKELAEIEASPADITEWVDVILLAFDGAWRSGASPEEIAAAISAKQTKNERRKWPDWRTCDLNKAIEHNRQDLQLEGGER